MIDGERATWTHAAPDDKASEDAALRENRQDRAGQVESLGQRWASDPRELLAEGNHDEQPRSGRQWIGRVIRECERLDRTWLRALRDTGEESLCARHDLVSRAAWAGPEYPNAELDELEFTNVRRFFEDLPGACLFPSPPRLMQGLWDSRAARIRAAMLCTARAFGCHPDRPLNSIAIAIELSQLAVQLQADVLEEGEASGRSATVVSRTECNWNNRFVLMFGDYLLATSYLQIAEHGSELCSLTAQAMAKVWEGLLMAAGHSRQLDWPLERQLELIRSSQAAFYELPCQIGAAVGAAPDAISQSLTRFGQAIGVSYCLFTEMAQLRVEDDSSTDRTATLLESGRYPLAVRIAAEYGARERLKELLENLASGDEDQRRATVKEVRRILVTTDATVRQRHLAARYVEQSSADVDMLPAGTARDELRRLVAWVGALGDQARVG